jgi:hypothetical protein
MKTSKRVLIIAAMGVALSTTGRAADLYTGTCDSPYETMYCTVVNARMTPVTLTIESLDLYGNVVDTSGSMELGPYQGSSLKAASGANRCKFAVVGSARSVVAQAVSARDDNDQYTMAVPAE